MSRRGVDLLVYADRLGGDLPSLGRLLDEELSDFAGVHLLPFFTPYDGADAGFDPIDHRAVDPRLGTWDDVAAIAASREVTADLVVNHVSSEATEFGDWLARGVDSPYDGMFLTFDGVFPDGARAEEIVRFYRPRPGLPFTPYTGADGSRRLVWTTFMPTQVDLDVDAPAARRYLVDVLELLRDGGVTTVRLDAVGYAVKTPGTTGFMTEETLAFTGRIAEVARGVGLRVLVEVHAHHTDQLPIAPLVDLVYDFATPPLLLHALGTGEIEPLLQWLQIRPANSITVLDTHDGIGVIDAGPRDDRPGLLSEAQMAAIFDRAALATGGHSRLASVTPQWASMPHQVNATFVSVLGEDPVRYLLARAVQLWLPGEPQVYYVGLLAGRDDRERFAVTGQGREVNRHRYQLEEFRAALAGEVPQAILGLVRMRGLDAFDGSFAWAPLGGDGLRLTWQAGRSTATLEVSCGDPVGFVVTLDDGTGARTFATPAELAGYR